MMKKHNYEFQEGHQNFVWLKAGFCAANMTITYIFQLFAVLYKGQIFTLSGWKLFFGLAPTLPLVALIASLFFCKDFTSLLLWPHNIAYNGKKAMFLRGILWGTTVMLLLWITFVAFIYLQHH